MIIKHSNRLEEQSESYDSSVWIEYGSTSRPVKYSDVNTLTEFDERQGKYINTGWYMKINIPILFTKKYVNPNTFEIETGPCKYMFLLRRRNGKFFVTKGFFPILS